MKPLVVIGNIAKWPQMILFPNLSVFTPVTFRELDAIAEVKNSTVLMMADLLTPNLIKILKDNENFICSFDQNDGACLDSKLWYAEETKLIDLIFKFSGIQKEEPSFELRLNNFKFEPYLIPYPGWNTLTYFKTQNRIIPMPHVIWSTMPLLEFVPFEKKKKTCLIRGSNHLLRYYLYLFLVKYGLADSNSGFMMQPYHQKDMVDERRFCEWCLAKYHDKGILYSDYKQHPKDCCVLILKKWQEGEIDHANYHWWNNRCLPAQYFYTEEWMKINGVIDMDAVEKALNALQRIDYETLILPAMFYGEYKWHWTINLPQRHWDAAKNKTVGLYPRHANEQYYFPEATDGKHYMTFSDTFEDLEKPFEIKKEQYDYITENCFQQYLKWIKGDVGGGYKVSSTLLKYVLACIESGKCLEEKDF